MPPRPEEVWAAAMVSAALCAEVRHHDDGSSDSQYDLDIIRPGFPVAAGEVVAAADSASIELWKLMNGGDGRWLIRNLRGGWMVTVMATARYRRLRAELPALLAKLEEAGLTALPVAAGGAGLDRVARDLQVASAWQGTRASLAASTSASSFLRSALVALFPSRAIPCPSGLASSCASRARPTSCPSCDVPAPISDMHSSCYRGSQRLRFP